MKTRRCVASFLMFVLFVGLRLDAQQSDTNSVANIKAKAEAGDAATQQHLGMMYDDGKGVPKDSFQAVKAKHR